jgi:glutamyl-tRNA synthetase
VADTGELYTLPEMIKRFSLKRVGKANASFDFGKLLWMNAQHIRRLSEEDYVKRMTDFWSEESRKFSAEKS